MGWLLRILLFPLLFLLSFAAGGALRLTAQNPNGQTPRASQAPRSVPNAQTPGVAVSAPNTASGRNTASGSNTASGRNTTSGPNTASGRSLESGSGTSAAGTSAAPPAGW
ncbi:hypothetical protein [Leptolyngbya sp. FACHB-261]|uniref:hypothetical protein n=1 Tax=Leptolyngbya sp. FACHB-261 TaxID=2692806 RepID=UPI001681E83F|nr:hypothetical protein [Leptolyngbya sp. FACHB-261]MBD2102692.1 hypothetical protein [Leptolyngbya sp. FACHB-261]